jgi:glycosyltransferase involved in cell wall biosynthesis
VKVLFVVGDASPTTASSTLLTFLGWVRRETDARVEVLLLRGGVLAPRFAALAPTRALHPADRWSAGEVVELGLARLGRIEPASRLTSARLRLRLRDLTEFDAVWLHGAAAAPVLRGLPAPPRAVACFPEAHLGLAALAPEDRAALADRTTDLVATTPAVAAAVGDGLAVPAERIVVLPAFVDAREELLPGATVRAVRRSWGAGDDDLVVGATGGLRWRDGGDLLARLAVACDPAHVAWHGGPQAGPEWAATAYDLVRTGLGTRVHVVDDGFDRATFLAAVDVLAAIGREDGLPGDALEAAAMGVPVVGFDTSAVAAVGTAVPFLDLEALGAAVARLTDRTARRAAGDRAAQAVRDHFDVRAAAPRWWERLVS